MSNLEKLGAAAIEAFELQNSLNESHEAIYNYSENPNTESSGKLTDVLSSQFFGHLVACKSKASDFVFQIFYFLAALTHHTHTNKP